MAKRFTDSEKWKKPFIRSMKAPYKLLWLYILDECDHAGIWQVDLDVAQIKIGEKLNLKTALDQFSGKIYAFENGEKWFIPDFIEFQYGTLNPENRAHKSVIDLLYKYNLLDIEKEKNKPLISPLQGAMDMDMDMDKDKDKDKDKDMDKEGGMGGISFPFHSETFRLAWQGWKNYKKAQHRFTFKGEHSEQIALKKLAEDSGNDEINALQIIEQSIANGWKGLFELKHNHNGKQPIKTDWKRVAAEGEEFLRKQGLA